MRTRYALTLAEAEAAVKAGLEEARREGWAVTIAVVDDAGFPILIARDDEATPLSVKTAIEKASSAGTTGLDTALLEGMIAKRPALVTMGRVAIEGGVPVLYKGQKVGGAGVSGVQSHQDAQVARAGVAAIDALAG